MTAATLGLLIILIGVIPDTGSYEAHAYYPAQIGDSWLYESSVRGVFTNEVVDSIAVDGSTVFRIRSTDAAGRVQTLAVRYDGPRVYVGPETGPEMLLADFGMEEGVSVVDRSRGVTVTLKARHETMEVFGRRFSDLVEVEHTGPTGGKVTHFFARGIGSVGNESTQPPARVRLLEATVGGQAVEPGSE
ncbi:MAG: hypothetical protein EA422_01625 [Gemmatimonadales bacterium]|nr:MAG: hypothetical protein EA422_01625 [Gemmatimonadales bacterium]